MQRLGALQFMGINDILQLQVLVRNASSQLNQMRVISSSEHMQVDSLQHACQHLQDCIHLLYESALPHLLRFTVVKQRALSTLQLFLMKDEIDRCRCRKEGQAVTIILRASMLHVVPEYIGPICFN